MSTEQMREWLKAEYPGKSWAARVSGMSDQQVVAVYMRLIARRKKK